MATLALSIDEFQGRMMRILLGEEAWQRVAVLTRDAVQDWYGSLPEDWFDNPAPFPDGTPRHGGVRTFMAPLSTSWEETVREDGFDIDFKEARTRDGGSTSNWGLRLQQYGGEINPTRKKALTIPVTAEARGRTVAQFVRDTGKKLFSVGKEEGDKVGTLVWEDPGGELRAAYALRKSSVVQPLRERRGHDAFPSAEQLAIWAWQSYTEYLKYAK